MPMGDLNCPQRSRLNEIRERKDQRAKKPECLENNDLVYIYGVSFVRILIIDERISRRFPIFPSWDPSSARCRICSVRNSTLVHVKQACSHCTGQEWQRGELHLDRCMCKAASEISPPRNFHTSAQTKSAFLYKFERSCLGSWWGLVGTCTDCSRWKPCTPE